MSTGIRKVVKKTGGSTGIRPPANRRVPTGGATRRPQREAASSRAAPAPPPADTQASTDYTLMSAPRERTHNVMRMLTSKQVDFGKFTPPVRMRRQNRDYYRVKNKKRNEEEEEQQQGEQIAGEMGEERPKADMNLIADAGGARRNKRNLFKKRTKQVYFADEEKRRLDIEEARPWILEDDDEKEVWTGELEGGQSSEYVLFVLAEDGFRVVPVDRWYKFNPKLKYNTMSLDEAEEELQRMQKAHAKRDLWIMHRRNQQQEQQKLKQEQEQQKLAGGLNLGSAKSTLVEYESYAFSDDDNGSGDEGKPRRPNRDRGKHGGLDEIEFEMEFEDDEELGDVRFEYNEEEESNRQRERVHTSMFASDDEDEDLFGDSKQSDSKDVKQLRKLMRKREGNADYESDREENPYLSEDDETSDESDQDQNKSPTSPTDPQKPAADSEAAKPAAASSASAASTSAKKRKRMSVASHPHHAARAGSPTSASADNSRLKHHKSSASMASSASAAAAKPSASSPSGALITKQEIIDLIRNGVSDIRELISHVRKKLQANPENRKRIYEMLKEVATYKNNKLTLKKP
ncbi:transcription factor IIF subunit tfg1 [Coemansia brasiliensis]|uniref:Transcription initiation factor IIF subunit alpha n=1 Tax=Coemansia brasiliensis TaxID=2650707 RepID=A0A9W8IAI5_9FUNG|nr:transcription factor IIF subunit tfg1 [Coemansia brasiliensis]